MDSRGVLTLPPEITSEIFSHYVDEARAAQFYDILEINKGPLALATVCKRWREICYSTCSLWAYVLIDDEDNWEDEVNLRFLERWLSRARSHPLDIIVMPICSTKVSRLFSLILQHSSQWRSLEFWLDPSDLISLDIVFRRLPCLIKLKIVVLYPDASMNVTAFGEAPSLREVSLTNLGSLQSIVLPCNQLTDLSLAAISDQECLDVLKETPNLQVLDTYITSAGSPLAPALPLKLAHVHTFTFWAAFSAQDTPLFNHLVLPALSTLRLNALPSDGVAQLLELGIRSSWSPRSIQLTSINPEISNRCLRSLPSLETVEICTRPIRGYSFAPLFELLASDDAFLPTLREVIIRDYGQTDISSAGLAGMLASRWHWSREGVARLRSFRLGFTSGAGFTDATLDEMRSRVRPLVDEGMDVVFEIQNE